MKRSALFAFSILFAASRALASPEDDAEADRLFKEGRALMLENKFTEACPKLERAQKLSPSGGTLLNVAACHERLGKIATAWAEFHDALTAAKTEGKTDRARLAQERIDVLEPRVPWLTIAVPESASNVAVTFDGATIVKEAFNKDMPIDPGEHRVTVTGPDRAPMDETFRIAEGERRTIDLAGAALPAPGTPVPGPTARELPAPVVATTPKPDTQAPAVVELPVRHRRHRAVFEIGAFGGFLGGDFANGKPDLESNVSLERDGLYTNCAQVSCTYSLGGLESFVGGLGGFAGVSVTERFQIGFRAVGALRAGGGFVAAIGPSLSGRVWGPIWGGFSFVVGDALARTEGTVNATTYTALTPVTTIYGKTGVTVGNALELGIEIYENDSGALMLQTTPVFLIGSRDIATMIPFGLAYRFY